jgi:hypothetical protein
MIELLTDNQASKRSVGIQIFNELSSYKPYQLKFNILELSSILQYKLWVSLTQDFHEPQNRLVALLPLLNSNSEFIKESFICKLEEISEDYGGHVTNVLESNLNLSNKIHLSIIERVKNYINDYYLKNIDIKDAIWELNPKKTSKKSLRYFEMLFSKRMSETIDKGAKDNSLFSIMTNNGSNTIQLSKGGGFKIGNKKEVSQLGKISSSFTLPRSYFVNPNKYEIEIEMLMKQDWSNKEYINIINLLENE